MIDSLTAVLYEENLFILKTEHFCNYYHNSPRSLHKDLQILLCDIIILIHWLYNPLRKLLYLRNGYLIERTLLGNRTGVTCSHRNSFYFSLCCCFSGWTWTERGERRSRNKRRTCKHSQALLQLFWTLAGTGHESCLFWREKVGQDPSAAERLLSSEMAIMVLGFIVAVGEATWLHEFKHLIYSFGP